MGTMGGVFNGFGYGDATLVKVAGSTSNFPLFA